MAFEDAVRSVREFDLGDLDLDNVGSWPTPIKVLVWIILLVAVLVGGYYYHIEDMQLELARAQENEVKLKKDFEAKAFQAANLEYMACLETQFTAAKKTIEEGKVKDAESLKAAYEADVAAYNEAVSAEEALAGQFNTEIREFRAANPG